MSVAVKICGLNDTEGMDAAVRFGARYVGLVFCPTSSHLISVETAKALAARVPDHVTTVGLFVDFNNDQLLNIVKQVPLKLLQLHGSETPQRVSEIRTLTQLPVMKAINLATTDDVQQVAAYESVVDYLLFDTKTGSKPSGGTGKTFDWTILSGRNFAKPWMLAGGLNAENLAAAVQTSGATIVDVSSGVEDRRAHKNVDKIQTFIELAHRL